jgi:hypothetical protein
MKRLTKIGFLALVGIMMFATACKKSPSTKLYNTWSLVSVEMPEADSVTLAQMQNSGIEYTFSKNGKYNYSMGETKGEGTFEINKEGTSMTTTEDGTTDMYTVNLSETDLQLTKGNEIMKFTVKK